MSIADDIRQLQETLDLIEAGVINENDDPNITMAKKKGVAAGKKVAQDISMGGPGKWAKPFKTTQGPNDITWTGIDPKTGMGTYTVLSFVETESGYTDIRITTTVDKDGRIRNTTASNAGGKFGNGPKGTHGGRVGQFDYHDIDDTTYDQNGRKTDQGSSNTSSYHVAPDVIAVGNRTSHDVRDYGDSEEENKKEEKPWYDVSKYFN